MANRLCICKVAARTSEKPDRPPSAKGRDDAQPKRADAAADADQAPRPRTPPSKPSTPPEGGRQQPGNSLLGVTFAKRSTNVLTAAKGLFGRKTGNTKATALGRGKGKRS